MFHNFKFSEIKVQNHYLPFAWVSYIVILNPKYLFPEDLTDMHAMVRNSYVQTSAMPYIFSLILRMLFNFRDDTPMND